VAAWTQLSAIVGPGRRLDPVAEDRLRAALGQARYFNRTRATLGAVLIDRLRTQDIHFSKDDLAVIAEGKKRIVTVPTDRAVCGSIGAAVEPYGQAPLSGAPAHMDGEMANLPDFGAH
jgi:hypothetical protein